VTATSISTEASPRAGLHRLFWRVHFWAGLITAPIVVFAACTGLLYVFTPQIEGWVHADLDRVPIGTGARPLDEQLAAAQSAAPNLGLRSVAPAHTPGATTQVLFAPATHPGSAHAGHDGGLPQGRIVYVDPATARVVGQHAEMERFRTWAKKLHSSALQGNGWRWLLELAASWMLVMFATGLAMWWPRSRADGGPGWRALLPRGGSGRAGWRGLHTSVGVLGMGLLVVILVTGLTWSRHAGENFRAAQDALGQAGPKPPKGLRSQPRDTAALSAQAVFEIARAALPAAPLQLAQPRQPGDPWRIDTVVRDDPRLRGTLLLDALSGEVLYRSGWGELPALAKATAVGIPFHRAEFGAWNQAVLALAALVALFSVGSGIVMWWSRRPRGRIAAPLLAAQPWRAVPAALWLVCVALAFALPVFGISLALFAAAELAVAAARRMRRAAA
jgi:uncharacterized iron-regulated membrane protein